MLVNNRRLIVGKLKKNETFESKPESTEKYRDELQRISDLFPVEKGTIRGPLNTFSMTECLEIQGTMKVETFFLIRAELPSSLTAVQA